MSRLFFRSTAIGLMAVLISLVGKAQNCDGYAVTSKGTKYQHVTYEKDSPSNMISKTDFHVTGHSGNNTSINMSTTDKSGKETINTDITVTCTSQSIIYDQKTIVSNQIAKNMKDPNVKTSVSGNNIETPNLLTVGQSLPDNEIDIAILASGMKMDVKIKTLNRKVEKEETVTVPAGTFNCMVVSSTQETHMLSTKKQNHRAWIAKGVGLVKEEVFDKKGNLEKTTVLNQFTR